MGFFTRDHEGTITGIQSHLSHKAKLLGEPTTDDKLHVKKIQLDLVKKIEYYKQKSNKKLDHLKRVYKIVFRTTKEGWEFDQPKDIAIYRAYKGTNCTKIHFILKHKK